jgi:hypothetical protein
VSSFDTPTAAETDQWAQDALEDHYGATMPVTEPAKPWRAEVTTADVGGHTWSTNALRFEDQPAALEYATNLARRWMLVTRWRAVNDTVPQQQAYEPGSEDGAW